MISSQTIACSIHQSAKNNEPQKRQGRHGTNQPQGSMIFPVLAVLTDEKQKQLQNGNPHKQIPFQNCNEEATTGRGGV